MLLSYLVPLKIILWGFIISIPTHLLITGYVWLVYWRHRHGYSLYDIFVKTVDEYPILPTGDEYLEWKKKYENIGFYSFGRWFPLFNVIILLMIPFDFLTYLIGNPYQKFVDWLKKPRFNGSPDEPADESKSDEPMVKKDDGNDRFLVV